MNSQSVRAIRKGETITVENMAGRSESWMVLATCEHRSIGYYCVDHRRHVANIGNLVMHLEAAEQHSIVAWCGHETCRVYRAVDQAQLDALTPARSGLPLTHGAQ